MEKKTVKVAIELPESFLEDYADFKALQLYIHKRRQCGDVFMPTNDAQSETGITQKSRCYNVLGIVERYFAKRDVSIKMDNNAADLKALLGYIESNKLDARSFISPTLGAVSKAGINRNSPNLEILGVLERYFKGNVCAPMEKTEPRIFLCNYEKPKY